MRSLHGIVPAPDLPAGPRSALLIATAVYDDPGLRQLRSPARDADRLATVLGNPRIGGFAVLQVTDQAGRQIQLALAQFLKHRGTQELIVVYLSCHGLLDARGTLYFAARDTNKDLLEATGIESRWLMDRLEECGARQQVLILDCCFSGAFAGSKGDLNLEGRLARPGRGRVVLTASRDEEYSFEGVPIAGGRVSSVFTAGLIEGLVTGAADADRDGLISVQDAHGYASIHVSRRGGKQNPQLWVYGGEGPIILARSPAGAVVAAAPLPGHIRASLESPSSNVRIGAVHDLGTLLAGTDPALALAARQALERISDADNPAVATTSRHYLHGSQDHPDDSRTMLPLPLSGAVSSSQLLVATESRRGHSLRIWDAVTGERKATIKEHRDFLDSTAFSPDGILLATSSNGQTARIWDATTGAARATLTGHQGVVWRVAFSPDSTLLATVGTDESSVRIWDASTGAARATLTDSGNPAQDVAFSPDNTLLATASGSTARVWDIATGTLRASLRGHASGIWALRFSPDGTLLATGSSDETARIWEAATGAVRAILIGHHESARRVAFSPDSTLLATMDNHCMLRIWDAGVGTSRATRTGPIWGAATAPYGKLRTFGYEAASILASTKYEGDGIAFSPDGALLAAFGNGNAVRIWDALTGAHRITLKNHGGLLRAVAFTAGNP